MKKYVLITWGIAGIGGGQYYTLNRCNYYRDHGYRVYICHLLQGKVLLKELNDYNHLYIPELRFEVTAFSKHRVRRIIKKIQLFIQHKTSDEVLVESNSIAQAQWAELLAKSISSKHFFYILGEHDKVNNTITSSFAEFKLKRGELAGITECSIPNLFNGRLKIENGEKFHVSAPVFITVVDYLFPSLENLSPVDYTIGVMARLEKMFVLPTLKSLVEFCDKHQESTFRVIVAGDTEKPGIKEHIKSLFRDCNNTTLLMTGYMSPIPKKYAEVCDLCISSSGCASITNMEGTLTISIDAKDCKPIGILGFTTKESVYRKDEPVVLLEDLLYETLVEKKYPFHREAKVKDYTLDDLMNKEVAYISHSSTEKEYFDFSEAFTWKNRKRGIKERLFQFVTETFGQNAIRFIHNLHHLTN